MSHEPNLFDHPEQTDWRPISETNIICSKFSVQLILSCQNSIILVRSCKIAQKPFKIPGIWRYNSFKRNCSWTIPQLLLSEALRHSFFENYLIIQLEECIFCTKNCLEIEDSGAGLGLFFFGVFLNLLKLQNVTRKLWQTNYNLQSSGTLVPSRYEHAATLHLSALLTGNIQCPQLVPLALLVLI